MKSLDSLEQKRLMCSCVNTKHMLKLRAGSGWLVQLNMGWLGFGTFQRPTHALVTESRWLLKISVELSVAQAINRAEWKLLEGTNFLPASSRRLVCATLTTVQQG